MTATPSDQGDVNDADEPTTDEGVEDDHEPADNRLTKARQEAKGLRGRLREAEAERDDLREAVTAMQRAEAVRLAGATLSNGEDLFRGGVDFADLLGEGGALDAARVAEAAARVAQEHPNWTPDRSVRSLAPGAGSHSTGQKWHDVLQGRD